MGLYSRRLGGEHTVQWSAARLDSDCSAFKEHGYYITADDFHLGWGPLVQHNLQNYDDLMPDAY